MNCFELNNRASDFIDGSLSAEEKKSAEAHLENCVDCSDLQKHYRIIISTLSSQPRSTLPVPIRKAPFSSHISFRERWSKFSLRGWWERVPWYFRTALEGSGIVFLVLLGVSLGPKVRTLYEKSMERRLDFFHDATLGNTDSDLNTNGQLPLSRGNIVQRDVALNSEDFAGEDDTEGEDSGDGLDSIGESPHDIRVSDSQIWRFYFKTDSPREMRSKVLKILALLNIPPDSPGSGGTEAPGGIQFDFLVTQSIVASLKHELQKIAPAAPTEENQTSRSGLPHSEPFTWYKNRSKSKIPTGKTRIVIWLSQL